jgi:flavin reductase (DIM6/NTAB) family NADH-FMN oxidoreductase RutF
VNIPSADMAAVTDFCGLHSGSKVDKSKAFDIFYGELKTPMISECPVNIECRLTQTVELSHGEHFIGEIVGTYMEDRYLTDGKPDMSKIDPLIFESLGYYWKLGKHIAKAFEIGKDYKPEPEQNR